MTEMALLADYDALRDKSYRDARLGPHVVDWLAWLELGGASPRTLDQYERDLSRLCEMFPTTGIDELSDSDLLHAVRSFPQKSRRVRKAAFDSFFKWAVRCRRLDVNPMAMLPVIKRHSQRWIDTFDDAEIEALTNIGLVDRVPMRILLDAGLREGEARHLRVAHAKLGTSELIVLGGKGGKDRVVPMGGQLATAIADLVLLEGLEAHDHLWYSHPGGGRPRRDRPIGEGSFARWWKRCLEEAGIRYRNPHTTRHSFATRWLRRGGRLETLSRAMGHESIRTTFDLYGHLDMTDMAADLALVEAGGRINPD